MKIAVDFDGTIVENAYPAIGKPRPFAFQALSMLAKKHQLILWTCRVGNELFEAVSFCQKNGVEFYAVNKNYPEEDDSCLFSRKVDADLYIDDRGIGGLPSWGEIYHSIEGDATKPKNEKKWWKIF